MFTTTKPTLTLPELMQVPVTAPAAPGKLWEGVPHGKLMAALLNEGDRRGVRTSARETRYWLSPDNSELAAAVCVPGPPDRPVPYLGVVASTTQRRVLTVFSGTVDPATRAATVPAVYAKSKDAKWMYTTHFDYGYVAARVWKWWLAAQKEHGRVTGMFRKTTPSAALADRILMAVGRKEILPWSRIGVADKLYRAGAVKTLSALQAAVAVPLTMANPVEQLFANYRLTALLYADHHKKKELT